MKITQYQQESKMNRQQQQNDQQQYDGYQMDDLDNDYMEDQYKQQQYNNSQQRQLQPLSQQYRTSINQLISQPAHDNIYSMQNIYQSLYQLSDYLWSKKINKYQQQSNLNSTLNDLSFDGYLLPIKDQLLTYQRFRKNKLKQIQKISHILHPEEETNNNHNIDNNNKKDINIIKDNKNKTINNKNTSIIATSLQSQLIKCYQQVPFIYFQQQFTLDFSNFHTSTNNIKFSNTQQMRQQQQRMNDHLDLIEINLFGQIHKKFQDYFKAAANFDYLHQSIIVQLVKLKQARLRINKVKQQFVQKSTILRKKIVERNNYQKTLKKLKLMRSLRKLPQIIQTILQSSLPYQCLQLLNTTSSSITQVKSITSIQSTIQNIKSAQTLVQLGLNKRYTDQLYMYVEQQVFVGIDFVQQFKKIIRQCRLLQQRQLNSSSISHNMSSNSRRLQLSINSTNRRSNINNDGLRILDQLGQSRANYLQSPQHVQEQSLLKNTYCKRQQAKQYQIAMILLQSYEYVDFPIQVTRIKLTNGLRVVAKRFQKQLVKHVKLQLSKSQRKNSINNSNIDQSNSIILTTQNNNFVNTNNENNAYNNYLTNNSVNTNLSVSPLTNEFDEQLSAQQIRILFDKVSVQSYTLHIKTLNQLFKQSINRYLGYVLTLVTQYQQKLHKQIVSISNKINSINNAKKQSSSQFNSIQSLSQNTIKSQSSINNLSESQSISLTKMRSLQQKSQKLSKLQQCHNKFKSIFTQQITILPSIFKIIQQKIKYFLTLKNMSTASPQQFYQWVGLVRYWQRWFDCLVQQSVLLNYACTCFSQSQSNAQLINSSTQLLSLGQDMVSQLVSIVLENVKKSISTMNLKNLITQLTVSYINSYSSIISSQLNQAILQQSWQSVQIPQQFSDILQNILTKPNENHNMSLTILNSSTTQMSTSFINKKDSLMTNQSQQCLNVSSNGNSSTKFKFKILKNNILLQGQRYKLTVSFLLLCQFLQQIIKVGRLFQTITGQTDEQSIKQSKYIKFILSHLYQKVYQLIQFFNITTKQMILQKKALKMEKIKGNNIAVKHICLLSNCLTFLQKLTVQIPQKQLSLIINKKQQQTQTITGLVNHNTLLIDKISSILNKKMEQIIMAFKNKQQQKTFSLVSLHQFITQSNQSIVTLFLQITQIIDEYLDVDKCERILKGPFQLFVQKYFKFIILKGDKFAQQARLLLEKMKFLKKYFKNQFVIMQRQVQQ